MSHIKINMSKAREICHNVRRNKRTEEFKPLDIEATIPLFAEQAEASRQVIRDRYDAHQVDIDAATTPEELKAILGSM